MYGLLSTAEVFHNKKWRNFQGSLDMLGGFCRYARHGKRYFIASAMALANIVETLRQSIVALIDSLLQLIVGSSTPLTHARDHPASQVTYSVSRMFQWCHAWT
jgi:hypothetical protein